MPDFIRRIASFLNQNSPGTKNERIWSTKFKKIEKLLKKKKLGELEPLLEEVRSWLDSQPEAPSGIQPEWLNQTGLIYQAYTGNFVRAEECFNRALEIAEILDKKREKALAMTNLGVLYLDQNRSAEAVSIFVRLKPFIEEYFGPESHEAATVSQNLAAAHRLDGNEEDAREERIKATGILRKLA